MSPWLVLLAASVLSANPVDPGALILLPGAEDPGGLTLLPVADLEQRLGLRHAPAGDPPDASAALADFERGEARYWESGEVEPALEQLRRARGALPVGVPVVARAKALKGLWLLAQMLVQVGREADDPEVRAVLRQAVELDPQAQPPAETVTDVVRRAHASEREAFLAEARAVVVHLDGPTPTEPCRVHIDGVARGALGDALGPFGRGPRRVVIHCGEGRSWERVVDVGAEQVALRVPEVELHVTVDEGALRLSAAARVEAVEAWLGAAGVGWSLVVARGLDGGLSGRLARGDAREVSPALAAPELAAWVREHLAAAATGPVEVAVQPTAAAEASGTRWWHWTLISVGAAALGAAGGLHAAYEDAVRDVNSHAENRVGEVDRLGPAAVALYAAGGAMLTAGVVLVIVGATSEREGLEVLPGPASVTIRYTF